MKDFVKKKILCMMGLGISAIPPMGKKEKKRNWLRSINQSFRNTYKGDQYKFSERSVKISLKNE
jgi:hypothetical protein